MAARVGAFDWASTSLGAIEGWPQSLKTAASMVLASPVPLVMLWGPDGIVIYNDAYSAFAGGRHPQLLGSRVLEGRPELAGLNRRVMETGLRGETLSFRSEPLVLYRHGVAEDVWADLDYSPIRDESGKPAGVLAIVVETTGRVRAERALRASEESFQFALDAAVGVGTWNWDIPNDRVYANPHFAQLYSIDPDSAAAGASIAEFTKAIHPDDREFVTRKILDCVKSAGDIAEEYRVQQGDGSVRWVFARGRCYHDEHQKPLRFPGVVVDVTERKAAETALRASVEEFRALAEAVPHHVWTATPDGHLNWFNRRVYDYTGAQSGDLDGERWGAVVHPEDIASAVEAWSRAFRELTPYEVEFRLRDANGGYRWFLARAVPVRDGNGHVTRWIGTNTDLHDQKAIADKLSELNATLEQRVADQARERDRIWRVSQDLLAVADFSGNWLSVNPAWTAMLGWSQEEVLKNPSADLWHPDDLQRTREERTRLAQGIPTARFENRYRHADGSYRWLSWTAVAEDGLIYAQGRDITAEKDAAEALRVAEEALRQSQKMDAVGQLTGGLAHDFNNILTGIIGSLDIIQTRIAQGRMNDVDRYAKAAMISANRAAALTHRLLAFARRQPIDPKPVNVNTLVTSMGELLRRTLTEGIALKFSAADGLWPTFCDPNQLENVLLNLAINARDAMPDGGTLTIETVNDQVDDSYAARLHDVSPGQYVCLSVIDTGVGMTPEVLARAFDPFFTTKPIGQGTGLGLSMVYGFAKQSNGHVRLYSQAGEGTTVRIYLPRYRGVLEAEGSAATEAPARAGEGETVLVVEDDAVVRELVVDVLNELGYRALEASDGPSGLQMLQSDQRIDLLVSDVGLPGLNGRQMADHAREVRPHLKVLFITGYAENAALTKGFLAPGMEMVTKPFAVDALAARIRDMIEG